MTTTSIKMNVITSCRATNYVDGVYGRDQSLFGVGSISGIVQQDVSGTVTRVPYALIRILRRSDGFIARELRADSSGEFQADYIPKHPAKYTVIAFDPDGGTSFNAVIFDKVDPV